MHCDVVDRQKFVFLTKTHSCSLAKCRLNIFNPFNAPRQPKPYVFMKFAILIRGKHHELDTNLGERSLLKLNFLKFCSFAKLLS